MAAALTSSLPGLMNPAWLTGPIFDKELRVSSRRKRNYVIRAVYVLLLTAFVTMAWFSTFFGSSIASAGYKASRMAEVGRAVIMTITWFQFIVAQLGAILMLSNAISDEIRRGTLDVLLTTPINSFQIVMGKLLGSLLQVTLLLATSLPLLAIVRIFGGMHWDYVVSSLAITLTAMILVGSVTMFLSVRLHRPYIVIIAMIVFLVVAYGLGIFVWTGLFSSNNLITRIMLHTNPFAAMFHISGTALRGVGAAAAFSWPVHCLIMLGGSLVFVGASVVKTREAATRRFFDRTGNKTGSLWRRVVSWTGPLKRTGGDLRQIKGSPIIWKELGGPLWATLGRNIALFVVLLVVLFLTYGLFTMGPPGIVYSIYIMGLWLIASIRTGAMAALAISKERETRTWPILLGTTLSDAQIVRDKALVVLWRNWPLWLVLAVNSMGFYLLMRFTRSSGWGGELTFLVFLQIIMGNIAMLVNLLFLICAGLYFGMRLKSTTAAVVATLASLLGLYFLHRVLFFFYFIIANFLGWRGFSLVSIFYSVLNSAFFFGVGIFFFRSVRRQLRKNVF